MERRLAAILAADVAGYSRLMGVDEAGTLKALKAHRRDLIVPKVAEHHGHIVKLMGDGVLVEFNSVVDAVAYAVSVQLEMRDRNRLASPDKAVNFRIGINIGDVIVEEGDIYGNGVNVAARLEALAEPGGICISRNVRDEIRNKLDLTLHDMGEIEVKNIARPVRTFQVVLDARTGSIAQAGRLQPAVPRRISRPRQAAAGALLIGALLLGGGAWSLATREAPAAQLASEPSIAVLPFTDLTGDPGNADFSTGLTEDIITALARSSDLPVFARESTGAFGGAGIDARTVGRKLGAQFVLAGTVRRSGNHLRVTARLVDAGDGIELWSAAYDREVTAAGAFALGDEVTERIVGVVASKAWAHLVQLYFNDRPEPGERALLAARPTSAPDLQCRSTEYVSSLDRLPNPTQN